MRYSHHRRRGHCDTDAEISTEASPRESVSDCRFAALACVGCPQKIVRAQTQPAWAAVVEAATIGTSETTAEAAARRVIRLRRSLLNDRPDGLMKRGKVGVRRIHWQRDAVLLAHVATERELARSLRSG
ncbi:MAG TPA: hypothetical protein VMU73_08400 [Gaiellaceae bacterium]|nr:hypothetical protein [Gaiellaceae bacterium]